MEYVHVIKLPNSAGFNYKGELYFKCSVSDRRALRCSDYLQLAYCPRTGKIITLPNYTKVWRVHGYVRIQQ